MKKEILWEAIKEPLRLMVLALIPFALSYFSVINTEWAIVFTTVLRFIDKYLHELGKETSNELAKGGLTRF